MTDSGSAHSSEHKIQALANVWTMVEGLKRLSAHGFNFATILDVGASDGKWTSDALSVFEDAYYLLFEPLVERKGELERLKDNNSKIDYVLTAVGAESGSAPLVVTSDLDGSRTLLAHEKCVDARLVPVTTLDSAVGSRGLPPDYLLKLDVHGYELPILEGAAEILNRTRVVIIEAYNFHITTASPTFSELVTYMERAGFICIDIVDPLRMTPEGFEWQVDLFFARRNDPVFSGKSLRF